MPRSIALSVLARRLTKHEAVVRLLADTLSKAADDAAAVGDHRAAKRLVLARLGLLALRARVGLPDPAQPRKPTCHH